MKPAVLLSLLLTVGCGEKHVGTKPDPPKQRFTLTVSQYGTNVVLRYPVGAGSWAEVCVKHSGRDDDRQNPGDYLPWSHISCWQPRFVTEEYRLRAGALTVEAVLWTTQDGAERMWIIRPVSVRPAEDSSGVADEPIGELR